MQNEQKALDAKANIELDKIRALPSLSVKDKLAIPPQRPFELSPTERSQTMDETNLGFTKTQAIVEANRCLKCKNPFCKTNCPIGMPIPEYLVKVAAGDIEGAIQMIREISLFPSICSRVCPHEKQCQVACALGKVLKDNRNGVSVGNIERFCSDYERLHLGGKPTPPVAASSGKRIAVIGGGPAGLACAIDLRELGHTVVLLEKNQKLGGVLRYGIPEFRLPKEILDYELRIIPEMGIEVRYGVTVGKDTSIQKLLHEEHFDAVFIAPGACLSQKLNVPGENLPGIFAADDYLRKGNEQEPIDSGKDVIVVGGGNVAMDASRMAFRLGAERVRIVYRRTLAQMPACSAEIKEALAEGVKICELRNPAEFLQGETARVSAIRLDCFELGAPDADGRQSPIKIEGQSETISCDTVVIAIGSKVSPEIKNSDSDIATNPNGTFVVQNKETGATSKEFVFVGGDAAHGPKTVVLAIKTGRLAAKAIHDSLQK